MKYIIEIEDVPFSKVRIDDNGAQNINLYRAKGFNSLVFDNNGLDKLTPLDKALDEAYLQGIHDAEQDLARAAYKEAYQKGYDEAKLIYQNPNAESDYQRGLDDAWNAAKKIAQQWEEETNTEHRVVIDDSIRITLDSMTASEAIAKLKDYEQQKKADEIKVGDEVRNKNHNVKWTAVVVQIDGDTIYLMGNSGDVADYQSCYFEKTGRHFPQVAELLKAMNDEQRDCHTCKHKVASSIECVDCRSFGKWEPKEGAE